jgi:hypothetical protein
VKRCYDKQLVHITVILRSKNIFSFLESFQTLQLLNTHLVIFFLYQDLQSAEKKISKNKMNCELMLPYDTPALRQTGSRNLTGQKTLPTIWGTYMKLVTKYQFSAINSCWEKCDEKCAYMFNVYKNQLSRQTGNRNLTSPKTLPTIWHTYMKLVTKYQIPVDFVDFYTHWTYMLIFRRIFLSNYWWQKSNIWSQASYRYPISWEAFLDPSDSYFLFADFLDLYTHLTYICICTFFVAFF